MWSLERSEDITDGGTRQIGPFHPHPRATATVLQEGEHPGSGKVQLTQLRPRWPDLTLAWDVVWRHRLALWFLLVDQVYLGAYLVAKVASVGGDALLYVTAAHTWLTAGDPWQVVIDGMRFAAPPPTLLFYLPFGFLSPATAATFWLVADVAAVIFVIRRLKLEWWWAIFPPIVESALAGNPEPVVLAFLISGSNAARGLAPLLKIYAFAPLLSERRWIAATTAALLLVITTFLLPWGQYLGDAPLIASTLTQQNAGLSAFSVPFLLPLGLLGLIGLGLRRSGWLAVPVLWPHTQLHYAVTALPEMTSVLAFGFSLPIPGAPVVAVAAQALLERRRARRHHGWI
jgi:hypothetical protein